MARSTGSFKKGSSEYVLTWCIVPRGSDGIIGAPVCTSVDNDLIVPFHVILKGYNLG